MVEFCLKCSNLLRKEVMNGKKTLVCKCGYKKELEQSQEDINEKINKKKEALEKNLIIVSEEDKISVHLKVKQDCPKCGNREAEAWQEQTRSADEPSTSFFRCAKCRYTWREY